LEAQPRFRFCFLFLPPRGCRKAPVYGSSFWAIHTKHGYTTSRALPRVGSRFMSRISLIPPLDEILVRSYIYSPPFSPTSPHTRDKLAFESIFFLTYSTPFPLERLPPPNFGLRCQTAFPQTSSIVFCTSTRPHIEPPSGVPKRGDTSSPLRTTYNSQRPPSVSPGCRPSLSQPPGPPCGR